MPATILSDNGVSSGSAGIKTTGANDGVLALQTTTAGGTATTAVTIGTDQSVTFAQSANLPNTFGFKNRIINGGMVIDQRNAGASVTFDNGVYPVDRFRSNASQTGKATAQQNAGSVTPPSGFSNYLGITSSSAYSVSSSDYFTIQHNIEGLNVSDLGWGAAGAQTVTLSFWVRSSLTGTFGGALSNSAFNRSYPFSFTISAANTWEQKSVTIAGDTSGTWLTTNGVGIRLFFGLGVGSTVSTTAGAWAAGNYYAPTGATSVVGTNGATFYITGVQLERGSTATSFDFRDYGRELILCQRYYWKTFPIATAPAQNVGRVGSIIGTLVGGVLNATADFPVVMRATPTITTFNPSAANTNFSSGDAATADTASNSERSVYIYSAATANSFGYIHVTASIEL